MRVVYVIPVFVLSALSVACSPMSAQSALVTAEAIIELTATPSATVAATADLETTEASEDNVAPTLRVWWPDSLEPAGNQTAALTLAEYMETFRSTVPDLSVEIRLKKAQDIGGIIQTLRTASAVAPEALPDITLLRRSDFLAAVDAGYIRPIQGLVTSAILGDLYPAALDLGRVNGMLYGLSYALDVEHIAYRPLALDGDFATFNAVLEKEQKFVFPAGVTQGLSDVLLLQYLSAGGTMTELVQGRPNADALETVLEFYQAAVQTGVIDRSVLDYARSDDYLFQLAQGKFDAGVITSTQYLSLLTNGQTLEAAPIPLATGQPSTVVNGWMWVVITRDRDQQLLALRFAEWMMDIERLAAYTRMVNMLPARRAAMRTWDGGDFTDLANSLLLNAHLPIAEGDSGTLRAMENALAAVISGQRTPSDAVQDVLEQLD